MCASAATAQLPDTPPVARRQVLRHALVRDTTALGSVRRALEDLRAAGIKLAVVTDDDAAMAMAQFRKLGWEELFDVVVGGDSGGPIPKPRTQAPSLALHPPAPPPAAAASRAPALSV